MALKMATKGAAKTALGIVPGGKLIASGVATAGQVASKQIYKRSASARNQWWKNHLQSGKWQRLRDKAELEYDLLDHDNSGKITKEEYLLSIPGMFHPDSDEAKILRERQELKEKKLREGTTELKSQEEIESDLEISRKQLEQSDGNSE